MNAKEAKELTIKALKEVKANQYGLVKTHIKKQTEIGRFDTTWQHLYSETVEALQNEGYVVQKLEGLYSKNNFFISWK